MNSHKGENIMKAIPSAHCLDIHICITNNKKKLFC